MSEGGPPEETAFRLLMGHMEALLDLLDEQRAVYWFDWGTLLGYYRHANIIPWDYDVDLCLLKEDYDRLLEAFARAGGQIGGLKLVPEYYGEPASTACILFEEDPEGWIGIDLLAYRREGGRVRHLMSPELVARYPGDYDFPEEMIFPLGRGHFLGRRVLVPNGGDRRVLAAYGEGWRRFPDGRTDSDMTRPPFRELARVDAPNGQPAVVKGMDGAAPVRFEPGPTRLLPGLYQKVSPGIDTVWILTEEPVEASSFTQLVFAEGRRHWGRPLVGSLEEGERLHLPQGGWVLARPSRPTRLEVP